MDRLIEDLEKKLAKVRVEISALQRALNSGDFSGPEAQQAIRDFNKAHPDNPVDPNDPDGARKAAQWALNDKHVQKDDLKKRIDDTRAQRTAKTQKRDNLAQSQAKELTDAAAEGEDALNRAADDLVATRGDMDVDITRAQITNRAVLESMDRAQAGPDGSPETISRLTQFRDQKTDQKPDLMPTQSMLSLSGIPDLNAVPLSSGAAMSGGGRTISVAGALDGDRRGPVTPEFTRVSAMKDLTRPTCAKILAS